MLVFMLAMIFFIDTIDGGGAGSCKMVGAAVESYGCSG
jgi:hypothetical protein